MSHTNGSKGSIRKPKRGRPAKRVVAERIPDTPENIARALLGTPPKKAHEWKYLK